MKLALEFKNFVKKETSDSVQSVISLFEWNTNDDITAICFPDHPSSVQLAESDSTQSKANRIGFFTESVHFIARNRGGKRH